MDTVLFNRSVPLNVPRAVCQRSHNITDHMHSVCIFPPSLYMMSERKYWTQICSENDFCNKIPDPNGSRTTPLHEKVSPRAEGYFYNIRSYVKVNAYLLSTI